MKPPCQIRTWSRKRNPACILKKSIYVVDKKIVCVTSDVTVRACVYYVCVCVCVCMCVLSVIVGVG